MAVTDTYASVVEYRAAAGKIVHVDDLTIRRDLVAVSRYIDAQTGRFFGLVDPPQERFFWGDGSRVLRVDDIGSVTGLTVTVDLDGDGTPETTVASADYQLQPLNALTGVQPTPYREIVLPSWSSFSSWPKGCLVSVTAAWGWPSVPEQVVAATIELTKILRVEGPRATNRLDEGGVPMFLSRDAQARGIISNLLLPLSRAVVA